MLFSVVLFKIGKNAVQKFSVDIILPGLSQNAVTKEKGKVTVRLHNLFQLNRWQAECA